MSPRQSHPNHKSSALTESCSGYLHIFWTGVSKKPSKEMSCRFLSSLQLYVDRLTQYRAIMTQGIVAHLKEEAILLICLKIAHLTNSMWVVITVLGIDLELMLLRNIVVIQI